MTEVKISTVNPDLSHGLKFYPQDQWGLDYLFQTCNKMYIRDILEMEEYPIFPGAFSYKNHPIYKVDILGVIVRVEERGKCFVYAVDDGTGVLIACCWKNTFNDHQGSTLKNLPTELRQKVREIEEASREITEGYQLGDLVHMKGKLQLFRNMKEIVAFYHRKVHNPMYETLRMSELPALYRQHYDKPFTLPQKVALEISTREKEEQTGIVSDRSLARELKPLIRDFLQERNLVEFTAADIKGDKEIMSKMKCVNGMAVGERASVSSSLNLVLTTMEEEGQLYRRVDIPGLYEVLFQSCNLDKAIISVLKRECLLPKYSEKGCHYFHIQDELRKTKQYSRIDKAGLIACLHRLEAQSDILSTTSKHYMVCS